MRPVTCYGRVNDTGGVNTHNGCVLHALLLENIHPLAEKNLRAHGIEVETRKGALDEDELIAALPGVNLLGVRSKTRVTARVVEAARQRGELLAVGAFCIGTNQIDLPAATDAGIAAFNAPFSNTRSVSELALAEIIALTRRLVVHNDSLQRGVWDKSAVGAHEVRRHTLGIVGYGHIGSQLSVLAEALGMQVVFYNISEKLAMGNARAMSSLDELLDVADVVTLHVDGRPGNAGFFGAEEFARMRPGSLFLNLSRGFVVDYDALRREIESGHIAGAAIDVYPKEPKKSGDPFDFELRGVPNVILTPHVAGSTEEAQEDIGRFVSGKLVEYVESGSSSMSVNWPNLALDPLSGGHRLAHLHRNVPGVLASVNNILANHDINVNGQLLATQGQYGYMVSDIGPELDHDTVEQLRKMPATVNLQVF